MYGNRSSKNMKLLLRFFIVECKTTTWQQRENVHLAFSLIAITNGT
jgi:hypothetical protein